ncbi:hypothetical protein [Arthrobacter sp. StoSoilB5]|uniref:hypothetical protein n=1 Tax=Arthrobacter sp. StoSoilB5 TaxID=2830992 RepID=UPI001CC3BC93|nr:hypothetical protein [Arthrobacter sp. StoSoilB5]BCW44720.1 hypothetical protein StoSoilB5_19040 [Arthrobacter sp. StoSoilB5]
MKYSPADGAFRYDKSISSTTHKYVFVGDDPDAVRAARQITQKAFGTKSATRVKVDMEPYHALSEIAVDEKFPTVGGVPQLGKVYRHLNSQLFLVKSPTGGGDVLNHFAGRPVRDAERSALPVFDPQLGFYLKERGGEDMVAEPA